jgi:hypothetical protein
VSERHFRRLAKRRTGHEDPDQARHPRFRHCRPCGALLLPSIEAHAKEWVCQDQGDGNVYCASEDGWCWLTSDPSDVVCGTWVD